MSILTLNDVHAALRQASHLDKAKNATQRRALAVTYAAITTTYVATAVSGKSLNLLVKNRELTTFGRVYTSLNALVAASATAVIVLETLSTDGIEFKRRRTIR